MASISDGVNRVFDVSKKKFVDYTKCQQVNGLRKAKIEVIILRRFQL